MHIGINPGTQRTNLIMTAMVQKHRRLFLGGIILLALATSASSVQAASSAWERTDEAAARLIAASAGAESGENWLGVQIKLRPGWKTYWRNPGESGAPPQFDWSSSDNISNIEVLWPAPQRFSAFGFDSFGYHDEVVLPVKFQAKDPTRPVRARLKLDYMICERVCIPMHADLRLALPADKIDNSDAKEAAKLIRAYRDRVPRATRHAGMAIQSAHVSGSPGKQILHVEGRADRPFANPDLMVEAPEPFGFGRPKLTFRDQRRSVTMALPVYAGISKAILREQALRLTLVDGARALEQPLKLGR